MMPIHSDSAIEKTVGKGKCLGARWWNDLKDDWQPESPPLTLFFANFGKAMLLSIRKLDRNDIIEIFKLIEEFLTNGSEELKDAVATGFLESVIHRILQGQVEKDEIWPFLGPKSKKYWNDWISFNE